MKLREHELDWIAEKLQAHLSGSLLSTNDIEFYYNHLPEHCIYHGEGFRMIESYSREDIDLEIKNNKCWSKNEDGCKVALNNSVDNKRFHLLKADLAGIDVNLTIRFLKEEYNYEFTSKFESEDEVIAFDFVLFE